MDLAEVDEVNALGMRDLLVDDITRDGLLARLNHLVKIQLIIYCGFEVRLSLKVH